MMGAGRGISDEVDMVELLFLACLSSEPANCQEQSLLYDGITPMTCMMGAQPALAEWIGDHPQFRIARWSCRAFNPGEKDV
jgi:hypothetical protein